MRRDSTIPEHSCLIARRSNRVPEDPARAELFLDEDAAGQVDPGVTALVSSGPTMARKAQADWNQSMREFADARGISYRNAGGRIKYPPALHEAFEAYLAGQEPALAGPDG